MGRHPCGEKGVREMTTTTFSYSSRLVNYNWIMGEGLFSRAASRPGIHEEQRLSSRLGKERIVEKALTQNKINRGL